MSTLFTIASGNITDNIFARTISNADTTSVSSVIAIGNTPIDIASFATDQATIWGVSFNVKSRVDNPVGTFSCKIYDIYNVEQGSLIVPISNFPAGDGSNTIESVLSQNWQTLKFDSAISTTRYNYYIRLSANTEGELYFYGLPQLDESIIDYASNCDVVATGNTTQGSFNPHNARTWSLFLNEGSGVTYNSNTLFNLSTNNFTIDFWCYLNESRTHRLVALPSLDIDVSSSGILTLSGIPSNLSLNLNTWVHIAVTRSGNILNGYVNGVKSNDITIASNVNFGQNSIVLGKNRSGVLTYMHGHLYNFRLVRNQALYSSNFSTPTSATSYTDNGGISPSLSPSANNISLLILDNKNYLEEIPGKLVNGTSTKVAPISPFNKYINFAHFKFGGGLQTNLPNPGTGNFTIETWFRYSDWNIDFPGSAFIFDSRTDQCATTTAPFVLLYRPYTASNGLIVYYVGADRIRGSVLNENQWYHIAVVKNANQIKLYINGQQSGATYTSTTINFNAVQKIGYYYCTTGSNTINKPTTHLANFRITNTAVYTSNFTPPSIDIPLPSIPGTQILLNFDNTNNQIFDRVNQRTLIFGKTPIISNSGIVGQRGRAALYFDGYSYIRTNLSDINSNNFTIRLKFSVSQARIATRSNIFSDRVTGVYCSIVMRYLADSGTPGVYLSFSNNGTSWVGGGSGWFLIHRDNMGFNGSTSRFIDVAFVNNNGTCTAYVDGKALSSAAVGPLVAFTNNSYIGTDGSDGTSNRYHLGYIDNFIVHNSAIYNSNFDASNIFYSKDAIFWLDGDGNSNSDLNQNHSQFIEKSGSGYSVTYIEAPTNSTTRPTARYTAECFQAKELITSYNSLYISPNLNNEKNVTLDYVDYPKIDSYSISANTDFTIECWFKTYSSSTQGILNIINGLSMGLRNGIPFFGKEKNIILSATLIDDNNWHHMAVSRASGNMSLYIDGVRKHNITDYTEFGANKLRILGDFNDPVNIFDGYICDLRIVKNQALYTTAFTVPSAALTNISNGGAIPSTVPLAENVIFLENGVNIPTSDIIYPIIDSNAYVTQAPYDNLSPFTKEEVYNINSHSGSIYFDGSSDLISVSEKNEEFKFGTNDFTIEFWYYPNVVASSHAPLLTWDGSSTNADGVKIYFGSSTNLSVYLGNNNIPEVTMSTPGSFLKQWSHITLTRKGNMYRLFVNGKLKQSTFYTGLNLSNDNKKIKIGESCNGYISDVRIVKGQALYIEDFNVAKNPLSLLQTGTSGSNVAVLTATPNLLIKGVAAGIYDGSANNTFLQEGSIFSLGITESIDNISNYKDNVLIFNGVYNNNYLVLPPSPSFDLVGDFWIDFWMNASKWKRDFNASRRILTLGSVNSVSSFDICINATGNDKKLQIFSNTNILSSTSDFADGLWHHVGIGRSGSTLSIYRDGILDASAINTINYKSGVMNNSYLGIYGDASLNKGRFEGKITGLRIINNECIHTSSFNKPTQSSTLSSDGGEGFNSVNNVSLYMKLNNIISPVNSHVITNEANSLSGVIYNDVVGNITLSNVLTSSRLPAGSDPNTCASLFIPASSSNAEFSKEYFKANSDWTIETFVYPLTGDLQNTYQRHIFAFRIPNILGWVRNITFSLTYYLNGFRLNNGNFPNGALSAAAPTLSTWYHVAVCRKNNIVEMYVNGTKTSSSTATTDADLLAGTIDCKLGMFIENVLQGPTGGFFSGDIYNMRIIDGRALYTSNFSVPNPSSLSTTADTVFLYNNAKSNIFYRPGPIEKIVIGGPSYTPITLNNTGNFNLNSISVQNNGSIISPGNYNATFNIINNGLKIGSGGKFLLSADNGYRKVINIDESKIQVLPGGVFNIEGQEKTIKSSLTGYYTSGLSSFALTETPLNWFPGDSIIFLPPSANRTQFEELTARTINTNLLSTTNRSIYDHQNYPGIPSVANTTRNVAIKGLSQNRRGWMQFDTTSNTTIKNVEFEHFGRDGKTSESMVFNIKSGGYFYLSGCYLDGSTSNNVDATSLFDKCQNINILNNVFYKYSGDCFKLNNVANNLNISNNLIMRSGINGIKVINATISGDINISDNITLANGARGTYLENVGGNIRGSVNWYNASQGLYLAAPTTGENKDLTNNDINVYDSGAHTVSYDTPFSSNYPDENSSNYTGSISWIANPKYKLNDDFTIEGFFKFMSSVGEERLFQINYGNIFGSVGVSYQSNTQTFRLYTNENNAYNNQFTVKAYTPFNAWHHIALVRKNDVISLFLNGEKLSSYNTNFEFRGTDSGIILSDPSYTSQKRIYGFRILSRAEYDASLNKINVPTYIFTPDIDTLLLYKRTIKTENININNIQCYNNGGGGVLIDNNAPGLKNTSVSNISCINNTNHGFSIDGVNVDYKTANSLLVKDIFLSKNTTGLNVNNMTGILSGVYAIDNTTTNIQLKLGNGKTLIKSVTGLTNNVLNPNMIIYSSKSLLPVIFDNIYLDKSNSFIGNYTGIPLSIGGNEFINFHFDNSSLKTVNSGFAVSLSSYVLGTYIFSNTYTTSAGVLNLSCLPSENIKTGGIIFMNKNRNANSHESFYQKGKRATDISMSPGNICEKLTPVSRNKFKSSSKFVIVNQNDTVDVKLKIAVSNNYNGSNPRFIIKKNPAIGFYEDKVIFTFPKTTQYTESIITTPAVSGSGIIEFFVDCDGTTGSVFIDEWKAK